MAFDCALLKINIETIDRFDVIMTLCVCSPAVSLIRVTVSVILMIQTVSYHRLLVGESENNLMR